MCKCKSWINNDIKESSIDADDDSMSTTMSSSKSNRYVSRLRRKSNDLCYALNMLEKTGNLYIRKSENTFFIAKVKKVNFSESGEFFEKGKISLSNYFKEDVKNIPDITFWYQRYYYYSRFDEGIQMDYESWYSVTPEELAKYIANLCVDKIVVDGFCGSGGNAIQVIFLHISFQNIAKKFMRLILMRVRSAYVKIMQVFMSVRTTLNTLSLIS
jgi:hypothetical protein